MCGAQLAKHIDPCQPKFCVHSQKQYQQQRDAGHIMFVHPSAWCSTCQALLPVLKHDHRHLMHELTLFLTLHPTPAPQVFPTL